MKKILTDLLPRGVVSQVRNYSKLMRVDKPIGLWLLLWPTLWALWLAGEGHPDQGLFVVFIFGVFIMRSAGCVLNDYADRKIDPYVERTRTRPIASGAVTPNEALILFTALGLIAVGLAAMLNRQAQLLAIIAAALTVAYPFVKRYISIPQFVLGFVDCDLGRARIPSRHSRAPLLGVVEEPATRLATEEAGFNASGDLEARRVARIAELLVQTLQNRAGHIKTHEVRQRERPDRVRAAGLHARVDPCGVRART